MLDYDTNNTYTFNHVLMIEENLISLILKINNMKISNSLNDYLNQLGPIENIIYSSPVKMIKQIINTCLKCVSVDVVSNNEKIDLVKVKLIKIRLKKIKEKENTKDEEWEKQYNVLIDELKTYSNELNKLMVNKQKINNQLVNLFKINNKEITKIDTLSNKAIKLLDNMNWIGL